MARAAQLEETAAPRERHLRPSHPVGLSSSEEKPVFNLRPSRVELTPGGSVDMVLTGSSDSPKFVQERLVCQGFVGGQGCSKLIMSVDVTCRFVAPMLSISSRQLKFYLEKVPGKSLKPIYEKLILENVLSLSLSVELSLAEPFSLCEASGDRNTSSTTAIPLLTYLPVISNIFDKYISFFDILFCQVLEIHYQGHPQQDTVELHAEVHFPNLHLSTTAVDFGCVLNCTGTRQAISITNCSLLPVSYHWVFLGDQEHGAIRYGGDMTTLSNLLPEQLLVDILAERFQLSDCHRGIVIDGLESVFAQSAASTLQMVLKALNNRKHVFVVNLFDSYAALKAREKAQREAKGKKKEEKTAPANALIILQRT
uniref:Hydin adenylate kinase-like domain-containing protein n=1 Tax=Cyclopterus lumpus TaxID=8103 RepID=A0A8C2Z823_CYCLU